MTPSSTDNEQLLGKRIQIGCKQDYGWTQDANDTSNSGSHFFQFLASREQKGFSTL
jgi:hypothetical protein